MLRLAIRKFLSKLCVNSAACSTCIAAKLEEGLANER